MEDGRPDVFLRNFHFHDIIKTSIKFDLARVVSIPYYTRDVDRQKIDVLLQAVAVQSGSFAIKDYVRPIY